MKIAVFGSKGLVGSRFTDLLKDKFEFIGLSSSTGFDIRNKNLVYKKLEEASPSLIVHLAAKTNVDDCENDKEKDTAKIRSLDIFQNNNFDSKKINSEDWRNDNSAFAINVVGTKNLVDFAAINNIKFIYISTDFIFDGEKGNYLEEDMPNPLNWYGQTKLWGEETVRKSLQNFLITRISYPYGFPNNTKKDFVWKIADLISNLQEVFLVDDQIITPTFIDDIVSAIEFLINENEKGIFHIVGDSNLSPYQAGVIIKDNILKIQKNLFKIEREKLYKGKAKRGFNLSMKNDKLEKLNFKMKTFEEGIDIIKNTL